MDVQGAEHPDFSSAEAFRVTLPATYDPVVMGRLEQPMELLRDGGLPAQ